MSDRWAPSIIRPLLDLQLSRRRFGHGCLTQAIEQEKALAEREAAITCLLGWFDLEEMARGLREISGGWDFYVARVREELLLKNQAGVTRWWNVRRVA